jgi:hypothetical protein
VGDSRPLRASESALLEHVLSASHNIQPLLTGIEGAIVQDMNDGGMGSLRFWRKDGEKRRFGGIPVEAHFRDEDGVLVLAAVIVDQSGALYELDLWKVDFSPLRRIPEPHQVQIGPPESKP